MAPRRDHDDSLCARTLDLIQVKLATVRKIGRRPLRLGWELMSALGQKRTFTHLRPMSALPPKADIHSEMNHTTTGGMGDGVCTPDRIELVDQSTDVELGCVDRYAEAASYRLVGHALGKKS